MKIFSFLRLRLQCTITDWLKNYNFRQHIESARAMTKGISKIGHSPRVVIRHHSVGTDNPVVVAGQTATWTIISQRPRIKITKLVGMYWLNMFEEGGGGKIWSPKENCNWRSKEEEEENLRRDFKDCIEPKRTPFKLFLYSSVEIFWTLNVLYFLACVC